MKISKRIISIMLAVVIFSGIFAIMPLTANATSVNGLKLNEPYVYNFTPENNNWVQTFSVEQKGRLSLTVAKPINHDGSDPDFYFKVIDVSNNGSLLFIDETDITADEATFYLNLAKGDYQIEYYVFYTYQTGGAYAGFMLNSFTKNWVPSKPHITHKVTKTKSGSFYNYDINVIWDKKDSNGNYKHSSEYDEVQVYGKINTEKWKLITTHYNSSYSYYYGGALRGYSNKYATVFFYKVRAVAEYSDGTKVYGPYSNILCTKTSTNLSKPKITVKSTKKKQVKVSWKKVANANSYTIYRSTKSNKGFKKIATTKKTSYVNKKLKSKKVYYYKVKANLKVLNVVISSKFSKSKRVKCK